MKRLLLFLTLAGSLYAAPPAWPLSPSEMAAAKTAREVPVGPDIFGVFLGRTPCQDLSAQLNASASEACNKVKCRLILYQDPVTKAPTTYSWSGKVKWTGKWSIIKGIKTDPEAIVYQLEPGDPNGFLSFLKIDENILFFLNKDRTPLIGNLHFSYTLNRILKTE